MKNQITSDIIELLNDCVGPVICSETKILCDGFSVEVLPNVDCQFPESYHFFAEGEIYRATLLILRQCGLVEGKGISKLAKSYHRAMESGEEFKVSVPNSLPNTEPIKLTFTRLPERDAIQNQSHKARG